jgi:hypothetical protein
MLYLSRMNLVNWVTGALMRQIRFDTTATVSLVGSFRGLLLVIIFTRII